MVLGFFNPKIMPRLQRGLCADFVFLSRMYTHDPMIRIPLRFGNSAPRF